ncbi:MAG: ATP-binding response regulator [Planctomycetota bacterium]|jgi:CheY-like chemotaxis protein/two-component sensor histidine kinase
MTAADYEQLKTQLSDTQHALRAAETAIEHANRRHHRLFTSISHELLSPLNSIIGLGQLARLNDLDHSTRTYLNQIHHAAQGLLGRINDLLDFSRIDSGQLTCTTTAFEIANLFVDLANQHDAAAHERNTLLAFNVTNDVPRILIADQTRLHQILTNLLSNAIAATQHGVVTITISWHPTNNTLRLMVSDSGTGIPPHRLHSLFNSDNDDDSDGPGLGLTICQRIIALLGGTISATSSQGRGTTVTVELPCQVPPHRIDPPPTVVAPVIAVTTDEHMVNHLRTLLRGRCPLRTYPDLACLEDALIDAPSAVALVDHANAGSRLIKAIRRHHTHRWVLLGNTRDASLTNLACLPRAFWPDHLHIALDVNRSPLTTSLSIPQAPPSLGTAPTGTAVLIADSAQIDQVILGGLLAHIGISPVVVGDGQAAVDAAASGAFHAVLLDVHLPILNGINAARSIRAQLGNQAPTLIAVTSAMDRAHRAGDLFDDCLAKPVDPARLYHAITRHIPISSDQLPADPASCDMLPALPDINLADGLDHCNNDPKLYQRLLRSFVQQQARWCEQADKALASGDHTGLRQLCHSLRGVIANLGATILSKDLAALERALTGQPTGHWRNLAKDIITRTKRLITSINASLPSRDSYIIEEDSVGGLNHGDIRLHLAALTPLIQSCDTDAISMSEELLRKLQPGPIRDLTRELTDACHNFEFDHAATILARIDSHLT